MWVLSDIDMRRVSDDAVKVLALRAGCVCSRTIVTAMHCNVIVVIHNSNIEVSSIPICIKNTIVISSQQFFLSGIGLVDMGQTIIVVAFVYIYNAAFEE
jgi:hypothetical protein